MGNITSLSVLTTSSISPAIPESFVTYMKSGILWHFVAYLFSKSYRNKDLAYRQSLD